MSSYTSFAKKPRRARRHWGTNWRRTRTSVSASPSNRAGSVPLQVRFATGQNRSKFAPDSLLEGTGFEPSVPLGGIGAPTQPGFAFGRRLDRLHGACALDRWAKGAGSLVIEGRRFHCYALRGKTEPQAAAHERCSLLFGGAAAAAKPSVRA